mmetsp:Transcript_1297/g.2642  ORF Transcript_1297/g.2642 Transcript_1297/m.2642 type:complete len:206 (+) Transcript_1297:676-1293(+)
MGKSRWRGGSTSTAGRCGSSNRPHMPASISRWIRRDFYVPPACQRSGRSAGKRRGSPSEGRIGRRNRLPPRASCVPETHHRGGCTIVPRGPRSRSRLCGACESAIWASGSARWACSRPWIWWVRPRAAPFQTDGTGCRSNLCCSSRRNTCGSAAYRIGSSWWLSCTGWVGSFVASMSISCRKAWMSTTGPCFPNRDPWGACAMTI